MATWRKQEALSPDDRCIALFNLSALSKGWGFNVAPPPFFKRGCILSVSVFLVFAGHQQLINEVLFSPDARMIASASFDKSIKLWDGKTGKYAVRVSSFYL